MTQPSAPQRANCSSTSHDWLWLRFGSGPLGSHPLPPNSKIKPLLVARSMPSVSKLPSACILEGLMEFAEVNCINGTSSCCICAGIRIDDSQQVLRTWLPIRGPAARLEDCQLRLESGGILQEVKELLPASFWWQRKSRWRPTWSLLKASTPAQDFSSHPLALVRGRCCCLPQPLAGRPQGRNAKEQPLLRLLN